MLSIDEIRAAGAVGVTTAVAVTGWWAGPRLRAAHRRGCERLAAARFAAAQRLSRESESHRTAAR